jgi:hypothetical protein
MPLFGCPSSLSHFARLGARLAGPERCSTAGAIGITDVLGRDAGGDSHVPHGRQWQQSSAEVPRMFSPFSHPISSGLSTYGVCAGRPKRVCVAPRVGRYGARRDAYANI